MKFPVYRSRRMRKSNSFRRMVRETSLLLDDLILPVFVTSGKNIKKEIDFMPGIYHLSIDNVIKFAKEIYDLGIIGIILFGIPSKKDKYGSQAYSKYGIVQQAIIEIKNKLPNLIIITDVCLCQYTDHGHCGLLKNNIIDNDATLEIIAKIALSHAASGADIIAPSDMMDGRVFKIREVLDNNNFSQIPILSYSVKYCSSYYGPFREAAKSSPLFGDRKTYQMDFRNSREALKEVELDLEEGADIIMVKPALAYLDIIYSIKKIIKVPVAAYNVSGEYSMIKAAGYMGWISEMDVIIETLISIKRAGADMIITYFALEMAKLLKEKKYI